MQRIDKTNPTSLRTEAQRLRSYADRLTAEADRASANAPGAYITGGSGRSRSQNRATERTLDKTIDNAVKAVAARKRADRLDAAASDLESNGPERRRLARYKAREKEIARGRAERKVMRAGELKDRLGVYKFPAAIVYCDKAVERNGDFRRLAILPYFSLELRFDDDCPDYWRPFIASDAAAIQSRRGEAMQISTCGQTVLLGE